nr:PREDICTED: LOW QUALITY PROTEIN: RNA-binding protein 26 [Tribolium castaneum]|eukprot:XP_008195644.1 PREDICTED: LOW QUALITY PROTEIN: RNA-binding protein 26 [Tribolium castaneum]
MIIEQPEAFKTWLSAVLKPMCDADPAALAKYVLALIKKDKSEEELHRIMVGQLEVFLENETESFVNLVLRTLETQDYITTPVIPNTNPPNPIMMKTTKETKPIVHPSELPNLSEAVNGSSVARKEQESKRDREMRKSDTSDKEDKSRVRSRHRSSSRNRSRSRSWDRSKRSKSRDRDQHRLDREKRDRPRAWRNKSPPRRFDRRRSRTPSPSRGRSRSRSPKHPHRGGRYRNRTPPRSTSRSRSRSAEKSRKDSFKDKDAKEGHSRPGTPTQDSNHGDMDLRLTNSTQSIQSVVVQQNSKRRCRDFDEKGYCMRGEMCPFDHGVDPVVLEDSALSSVLTYNPNAPPTDVPPIGAPLLNAAGHGMMGPRGLPPEYNPQAPSMWTGRSGGGGGFRGPRPMGIPRGPMMGAFPNQPNMQRELIPVPVMDNKQPEQYPPMGFRQQSNYAGPRSKNPANCSLELKKIPQGLNTITHLNNHFSKFGKPVNIQVNYEGDPEAAIVTFSSHAEANAAYRSTEAVLNNRFIKVFWHNGSLEGKQENVPPRSVKDRLGVSAIVPPNTNKVLNLVQPRADNVSEGETQDKSGKTATGNKEETKAQAAAAIKKNQELLAAKEKLKKNQDEQRKEVLKIKNNLRKRKQELLEKQLSQQKILIEKMEKLPPGPQRDHIMETIKKTQESIESIKKDLLQSVLTAKTAPQKKAKEDVQREMLDAELDLITKQQEGADTSEIQKKLFELKARAAMTRGRGRGRRYNQISRHLLSKNNLIDNGGLKGNIKTVNKTAFQKHTVDHRPTRLLVSGYEADEQESVLNHFQLFGEIADYVVDSTLPSIITLNYKTRKEAEMALLKGKHFQDRTLSITWCSGVSLNNQSRPATRTVLMSESEEDRLIEQSLPEGEEDLGPELSEEALLQDDEEEDDESEDRSWRR